MPSCHASQRRAHTAWGTTMLYSTDLDFRSELSPRQAVLDRGNGVPASPLQQRRRKAPFMIGVAVSRLLLCSDVDAVQKGQIRGPDLQRMPR